MPHEYTRQRQGRDFSLQSYLAIAAEEKRKNRETSDKADADTKSLAARLEYYKQQGLRNTAPIDGNEPSERKGMQNDI